MLWISCTQNQEVGLKILNCKINEWQDHAYVWSILYTFRFLPLPSNKEKKKKNKKAKKEVQWPYNKFIPGAGDLYKTRITPVLKLNFQSQVGITTQSLGAQKWAQKQLWQISMPLVVSCRRLCYQCRSEIHTNYFTRLPAWCFQVCSLAPAIDFSQ